MLPPRLARVTAIAALLASLTIVADAAHAGKKGKGKGKQQQPEFTVDGTFSITSTLTSVCKRPGYGKDVVVTEKAITIRKYTFRGSSGTPGSPGRITSTGEESVQTDTKVAGETDLLKDQTIGPVTKVIPGSTTTFNATFQRAKEGKGRHRHEVLQFDMTGLAGSSRSGSIIMPRRGATVEHFVEPLTRGYKDRPSGDCTYSDQTFTSGFVNVTRRR